MNIRITKYDHANHYDNEQLGLIIPKDRTKQAFATVRVGPLDYKCVDVSRDDAKALLITMRKVKMDTRPIKYVGELDLAKGQWDQALNGFTYPEL